MNYASVILLAQGDPHAAAEVGEISVGLCRQHDEHILRGFAFNSLARLVGDKGT